MTPLSLDLVVCTYNNAALLDRTLGAMSRLRVPAEIRCGVLVVDNNCADGTPEVVARWARRFPVPLRIVREPRQGLTPARLRGVRETDGEWIAFVDDDCLLAEDWLEQAACFAAEHPACGAFGGRVVPEWEREPPPYVLDHRYAYAAKSHGDTPHRRRWLAGAGMVVRRAALEACGWTGRQFLEDRVGGRLVSGGDVEIGLRVAAGHEVWFAPGCTLTHLIPERRMTRPYLRRITRGLGAGRHHAAALTWTGSYPAWLLWSLAGSLGFLWMGARQVARGLLRGDAGVDVGLAFAPLCGWWAATREMLRMDPGERRALLGCAAPRRPAGR
ncbi:MAG: glycosyltransferase family 2 protein [Gemmatimonadetes bacterium]|nr:glycosyltransferase family 2 protein [Gemmatimonadota bacterium]